MVNENSADVSEQQRKLMKVSGPWRLAGVFLLVTALVGVRVAADTRLRPSMLWLTAPAGGLVAVLLLIAIVRLGLWSLRVHGLPDPRRLQRTRARMNFVSGGFSLLFGLGMGIAGSVTGHPAVWLFAALPILFGALVVASAVSAVRRAAADR